MWAGDKRDRKGLGGGDSRDVDVEDGARKK